MNSFVKALLIFCEGPHDALRACPITAGFVEFISEFWRMAD